MFCKKGVLKSLAKFTEKHMCQACNFMKKQTLAQVSLKFSEHLFQRTPLVAAFVSLRLKVPILFHITFQYFENIVNAYFETLQDLRNIFEISFVRLGTTRLLITYRPDIKPMIIFTRIVFWHVTEDKQCK